MPQAKASSAQVFRIEPTALSDATETRGHARVIAEFLDALLVGRMPEADASDNISSLAMVFAAIESANKGQRVAIEA